MPHRVAHPPHLPVAPLANRDLHDTLTASKRRTFRSAGALASSVEQRGFRRKRASPIERDPFAQLPQLVLRDGAPLDARQVRAGNAVARVGQAVGQLAVVGQQDQPGGVGVEPADRIEALPAGHELHDRRPALRVVRGRDDAGRLVERVHRVGLGRHRPAVEADVAVRVHVARRIRDRRPVHGHPPVGDQPLGGAAGGDPRMGEILGQAHGRATLSPVDLALLDQALAGEPAFRARQVWRWAATGAAGYDEMTDLPAALRERLAAEVPFSTLEVVREAHASDGTVKALFHTRDGRPVEAVLMRYRDGRG